jgi:protein SCO1
MDIRMSTRSKKTSGLLPAVALAILLLASPSVNAGAFDAAGPTGPDPGGQVTKDITVTEHTGDQLPLDLPFTDENGKGVRLRQYFTGKKPVIIQLGYYACPMLCDLISRGLVDSVKQVSLVAGKDYELVFVSIDPAETPELAKQKKENYLKEFGRDSDPGWHFLTGKQEPIAALAKADGFQYKWVAAAGRFAHPASLTLCMPDGRISRYLYGVRFDSLTLRESLVEASGGKVGTALDRAYLTCFQFDGKQGKYAFVAISSMRAGGVLIMIIIGFVLVRMFRREAKQREMDEEMKPAK